MDFSKFSDPDFAAKDWINQAFRMPEAQNNKDRYANSLVMKLQLFIQEVSKSLEETSGQIVQTMPRILREVESMQQEAVLLQNRMKAVQQDVQKVEAETASAMDSLLKIDTVKGRMQGVEKSLRELDNWTALTSDIEEVFASGDANLMASRLTALQQSLQVIGDKVPDFKERNDYLDRLKDQFIAAISPSVVAAFTSRSAESVQYFSNIFENLDRVPDLEQYYQKCLKSELNKSWNELITAEKDPTKLIQLLSDFYDSVLTIWFSQMKWCGQAFKSPSKMICASLTTSLGQLDPSINSVITDRIDSCSDKLNILISLKLGLGTFLDSMASSLKSGSEKDGEEILIRNLTLAVYSPLVPFIVVYQQYQQSALLEKLNVWSFEEGDFSRNVARFGDSLTFVFDEAHKAIDVCESLTGSFGLPSLLKAFHNYFNNYLTMAKKLFEAGTATPTNRGSPRREASFSSREQTAHPEKSHRVEENWDKLEMLVTLMRTFGSFFMNLERLEEGLGLLYVKMVKLADASGITGKSTLRDSEEGDEVNMRELPEFEGLLLNETVVKNGIEQLMFKVGDELSPKLMPEVEKVAMKIHQKVIRYVTDQIFSPMDVLFDSVPKQTAWSSASVGEALAGSSIPSFGLAPQEYITKVGQYMMTLAHHLEPFLSAEDASFCAALKKGNLPHIGKERKPTTSEEAVQLLLDCAGQGVMLRYSEAASRIRELSNSGAQQLATDIDYLSNVMEDLGLVPSETMVSLRDLLRMDPKKLKTVSESYPAPLVSAVREMRKIDA